MADKMGLYHKESFIFTDAISGREVLQLTNSYEQRSVHGYYDLPPWSPTFGSIAFSRMASPDAKVGDICVMDADGDSLTTVAHSRAMSPNGGALAQWSADGHRVYFRDRDESFSLIAFYDVETNEHGSYPIGRPDDQGVLEQAKPIRHIQEVADPSIHKGDVPCIERP